MSRSHGMGQAAQAQLVEPRQEFLQVLAAEYTKDKLGSGARSQPRHDGKNGPGQEGVVQALHRLIPVLDRDARLSLLHFLPSSDILGAGLTYPVMSVLGTSFMRLSTFQGWVWSSSTNSFTGTGSE